MAQVVKYTPKSLYSGYSLLTISDILEEEKTVQTPPTPTIPTTKPVEESKIEAPFKVSQRKILRGSKR